MLVPRNCLRAIFVMAAVFISAGSASGEDKPLTMRDIGRLRHDRVPLEKIVEKATEQGIGFAITPGTEKQLARLGFTADQIAALKQAAAPRPKEETGGGEAEKVAPVVPGQGLKTSEAERDRMLEQITKITRLSGVNIQSVASGHITLWAAKDVQAAFLPDIKKIEKFLEGKCREPLRSGLDKRSSHLVLLKTRYDYEKWVTAMFEVLPESFKLPDSPDGNADLKAAILKWSGYYSHNFVVLCMEKQEDEALHRGAAAGVGFMNFSQQVDPERHDPLATGFANGAESIVAGSPSVMLFSNSYQNEDRDLGNDPRAWLHLVQDRMRAKKESSVRGLLSMDTTNMHLPHYAEAWTLVGVLIKQPDKFGKLLLALRDEKEPLKAIEQIYGWDEKKLEAEWRKEVLGQR